MDKKKKSKATKEKKNSKSNISEKATDKKNKKASKQSTNSKKKTNKNNSDLPDDENNSTQSKSEKVPSEANDLKKIELKIVRKDCNGIVIKKSNKKKYHICFLDKLKKPLAEIIDVESYKKINQLLFEGFAEKGSLEDDKENIEKDDEIDDNKDSSSMVAKRRQEQQKIEAIATNKAVCSTCNIF